MIEPMYFLYFSLYKESQVINQQQYKQNTTIYQETSTSGAYSKMKVQFRIRESINMIQHAPLNCFPEGFYSLLSNSRPAKLMNSPIWRLNHTFSNEVRSFISSSFLGFSLVSPRKPYRAFLYLTDILITVKKFLYVTFLLFNLLCGFNFLFGPRLIYHITSFFDEF